MGLHDEAKLDVKFTDFAKQMNLYLNHFPKHEKYGLSQVIRNKAYEVYGFIVESQKRYQKRTSLGNADIAHEQLRMFLRLAFELGYFAFKDGAKVDKYPAPGVVALQPAQGAQGAQLCGLSHLVQHPLLAQAQPLHIHAVCQKRQAAKRHIHPGPRPPHGQLCPSFANPKRKIP